MPKGPIGSFSAKALAKRQAAQAAQAAYVPASDHMTKISNREPAKLDKCQWVGCWARWFVGVRGVNLCSDHAERFLKTTTIQLRDLTP